MTAYYNENDPYAAQWLRNLIAAGHIAAGDVDERSIEDVAATDVAGYRQCHFFAGIGVWSYALRQAGVPDEFGVWTGSCPCQPFSIAGKRAGLADKRHLWPHFARLIRECRPAIVFGEQVASPHAAAWLDAVCADVEGMGYAFGAAAFPAAGLGAPHIRDRAYWMADSTSAGPQGRRLERAARPGGQGRATERDSEARGLALAEHGRRAARDEEGARTGAALPSGAARGLWACAVDGFWRAADWLCCTDGRWRPVEPGTFPLAHGATARVGRLRAYGNAVCAEQARAFIEAALHEH